MSGAPPKAHDDDADSFSSDSDDEFLTMREEGKTVDREALIRKKLLESFYGKASSNDDVDDSDESSTSRRNVSASRRGSHDTYDDFDDDSDDNGVKRRSNNRRVDPSAAADLDSPDFDAAKHTEKYVLHSGVHPLLETEEGLACEVRTLDSSMQTLVYENYSRFIEATDAIRSIGVNVQANSSNLKKLSTSMFKVGETAREVETSCGALRDSVVEKLRVKRLLHRLDALLKLPSTLRENIAAGRYRWASKSYLTAFNILNKHSSGFESLQRIEGECYEIMEGLLVDVRRNMLHWSGKLILDDTHNEFDDDIQGTQESNEASTLPTSDRAALLEDPPDPPKNVAEIFECAGTPVLMLHHRKQQSYDVGAESKPDIIDRPATITRMESRVEFDPGLTIKECQEMALSACLRLVERFLDTHHIELQEALFAASVTDSYALGESDGVMGGSDLILPPLGSEHQGSGLESTPGAKLIPTKVLDIILEAATLYSIMFSSNGEGSEQLSHFVSTAYFSFLQHVRSELLDQVMHLSPKDWKHEIGGSPSDPQSEHPVDQSETGEDTEEDQVDPDEKAYEHITSATSLLLESVRQLGSVLSLPEVAIDLDFAANLVDQAVELSEDMVRKRVEQKFYTLRFRVIEECLSPFCRNALQDFSLDEEMTTEADIEGDRIAGIVQMANVALSDSLQLVDDTVRSILSSSKGRVVSQGSSSSLMSTEDSSMMKTAVEQSSNRFAIWLASAMESLAGCESSEPGHVVDVRLESTQTGDEAPRHNMYSFLDPVQKDDLGDDDNELAELVENCMAALLGELDDLGSESAKSDLTLAIVEMCRTAQGSIVDDIASSIATHTGSISKQRTAKAGLFATDHGTKDGASSNPTTERFRLAASRVLNLYAVNRGNKAGELLTSSLWELAKDDAGDPIGPQTGVRSLLEIVKSTCYECAGLFGGPKRAGSFPENLDDEYTSLTATRTQQVRASGLAFDVERMFAEKVDIYPHPYEFSDFQRNSIVALVFKVALKALMENSRLVRFSVTGYRQFMVDVEFLKFVLPHYVKDELLLDGSNAQSVVETLLVEAVQCSKERCGGSSLLQDSSSEVNQARAVVRDFLAVNGEEGGIISKITIQDDENESED